MDKKRKDSNARMAQYLKEGKRKQTLQTHFQLEERKARFFSILQDNENWTVDSYKKKYDITVSYKKYEVTRYYKKGNNFLSESILCVENSNCCKNFNEQIQNVNGKF